jgi:XTP/dITP diphosphohydrolase
MKEHNVSAYSPEGKAVFFATRNFHKFNEARHVLAEFKIATAMLRVEAIEIQNDNIENIAKASATDAFKKTGLPLIVEDAGLFIEALNGFPGPYSSYVYKTLGTKGILKLMEKIEKRDASFHSVVTFYSPKLNLKTFHGEIGGEITTQERGDHGFGYDPIFKLSNNRYYKTFAEMNTQKKNKFSHRAKALRRFAKWYKSLR